MERVVFPDSLQKLILGSPRFNQPMEKVLVPNSVKHLKIGRPPRYNHSLEKMAWPDGLQVLEAPAYVFDQLPANIKRKILFIATDRNF